MSRITLWGVVCAAGIAWSVARADTVVMKNGDRVSGGIVKQDGKTITIKTPNFGLISAPWDQVESVKTDTPVTVVLQGGKSMEGTLATSEGRVEVVAGGGRTAAAPAEVTAIRNAEEQRAYERLLSPGWADLWTGTGALGVAGTQGNAKTSTFTTAFNASRSTNTDKTFLYFSAIKASALVAGKSAGTAQAIRGGLGYNHNVSPRVFINTFNDYEYDKFQNLDLRFVIGGGLGFHAVKSERSVLDLVAGADYSHASFNTPLTRNSGEFYWGDDYTYQVSSRTALVQGYRMFVNLTNRGEYRMNFDLGSTTKIAKWLTWNLTLSDRYLSNPAPGRKTNDWLYTTGIGFTFTR